MFFKNWLLEGYGQYNANNTIVVDIQPEYKTYIRFDIGEFVKFITQMVSKRRRVIYFFNGDSIGSQDNEDSIKLWLAESLYGEEVVYYDPYYGEDDSHASIAKTFELLNNITFYDKGYGFFRGWMDQGVDERKIIQVIRAMVMRRVNDSRDFPEEWLAEIMGEDFSSHDSINLPDIDILGLRQFNNAFLCGGGKTECLREVQLLMNALNIKYKEMSKFIY